MAISRFFVDELIDGLGKLSEARQRACLFALEADLELEQVANMTWRGYRDEVDVTTPLMAEVIASQVRHLRLPYVFWEFSMPRVASPLLDLQKSIESAFRMPWGQLQQAYKSMVWIDRREDARHFTSLVQQLAPGAT